MSFRPTRPFVGLSNDANDLAKIGPFGQHRKEGTAKAGEPMKRTRLVFTMQCLSVESLEVGSGFNTVVDTRLFDFVHFALHRVAFESGDVFHKDFSIEVVNFVL